LLNRGGLYAKLWAKQSGLVLSEDGLSAGITPERLGQIPLFSGLGGDKLAEIAATLLFESARPGDELLQEKQSGGRFYIIVRGMVELSITGRDGWPLQLEILEVGDFFGEIALLEDIPQVATARALTPCTLLSMRRTDFQQLLASERALYDQSIEIIDRRLQAKIDELVYKRIGTA
jgi:ATP-binding cassette subfamily B protein